MPLFLPPPASYVPVQPLTPISVFPTFKSLTLLSLVRYTIRPEWPSTCSQALVNSLSADPEENNRPTAQTATRKEKLTIWGQRSIRRRLIDRSSPAIGATVTCLNTHLDTDRVPSIPAESNTAAEFRSASGSIISGRRFGYHIS